MAIRRLSSTRSGAKSSKFWDQSTVYRPVTGAFEPIATVNVGAGGQSTIVFNSIPSTYTHLQLRSSAKNTAAGTDAAIRINSGTASNIRHQLFGDGANPYGTNNAGDAYIMLTPGSSGTSVFGADIVDFLDYANTNKNKVVRVFSGRDLNGSGMIGIGSALWTTTSAITDITIISAGTSFAQYSTFSLYGVK